jgi:hypothetical protein
MKFLGNLNPRKSVAVDFTTATEESRKLYWDDNNRTLSVEMGNGVVQQIGQEQFFYGRNNTATTITNGTVCMVTGALGESGRITIAPMVGNGTYNANLTLGVATEDIATGEDGLITYIGAIHDIDTTGTYVSETWVAGDRLYVHPSIPGAMTKVQPQAPNVKVIVGRVLYSNETTGSIYVRINVGSYLGGDSNVEFTNLIDKNVIRYNDATKRWENISQADLDIVASQVDITDAGNYYNGTEVESALQQTGSELTELKKNLYNTMSTGALHFGGITKVDDTHFNVGSCYGYIVDNETDPANPTMTRVLYSGGSNLTTPYLTTAEQTQIFLKSDGTLYFTDLNPAPPNYVREMILLGRIIHSDRTIIRAVETGTFVASSVYSNLRDIWLALGPINSGVYVYPNGAKL